MQQNLEGVVTWKQFITVMLSGLIFVAGVGSFVLSLHTHPGLLRREEAVSFNAERAHRFDVLEKQIQRLEGKIDMIQSALIQRKSALPSVEERGQ